jgi:hypothetical protein
MKTSGGSCGYNEPENKALGLVHPLLVMMESKGDGDRVCQFFYLKCRYVLSGSVDLDILPSNSAH